MTTKSMIVAGIMSGTSLDGVDVAIVEISAGTGSLQVKTLGVCTRPYPEDLRAALLAVSNHETHTRDIARLHFLRAAGYDKPFTALEDGVGRYVNHFLSQPDPYR